MIMNRRRLLKSTAIGTAAAVASPFIIRDLHAQDIIKVAGIHDTSGGLDIYGKQMVATLDLAVNEINAAGGVLGKKIALTNYDPQSNIQLYTQYATEAATKEKVAVVHGGITSASREAIRPLLKRFNTLYFYNTLYEGGVCDRNIFCTGSTPAQTVEKTGCPTCRKKWGKKIYTIAADYNYGQITAKWVKKYAQDNGGEVVQTDFFPLDVTDFGPNHQEDPGGQARSRDVGAGRRRAYLVLPPVGGGGHEQADPAGLDHLRQRDRHHLARGAQRLHRGPLPISKASTRRPTRSSSRSCTPSMASRT